MAICPRPGWIRVVYVEGTIPAPTTSNAAQVAAAKRTRVNATIFLAMVSPEFQIQK